LISEERQQEHAKSRGGEEKLVSIQRGEGNKQKRGKGSGFKRVETTRFGGLIEKKKRVYPKEIQFSTAKVRGGAPYSSKSTGREEITFHINVKENSSLKGTVGKLPSQKREKTRIASFKRGRKGKKLASRREDVHGQKSNRMNLTLRGKRG